MTSLRFEGEHLNSKTLSRAKGQIWRNGILMFSSVTDTGWSSKLFLDTQCERQAGIIAEMIKTCAPFSITADSRACGGPLYRLRHLKTTCSPTSIGFKSTKRHLQLGEKYKFVGNNPETLIAELLDLVHCLSGRHNRRGICQREASQAFWEKPGHLVRLLAQHFLLLFW